MFNMYFSDEENNDTEEVKTGTIMSSNIGNPKPLGNKQGNENAHAMNSYEDPTRMFASIGGINFILRSH